MAFLQCSYYSFVLKNNTNINVIIPTPEGNEQIDAPEVCEEYSYVRGMPVIYLLHGAYGNNTSWSRFSSIERYVQKYRCIAVMASAENSFYQDMFKGAKYYTFFTEELRSYILNLFPASASRDKNYIAGFSMGGYGAFYLALKRPDLFSKAISLSGALDIHRTYQESKLKRIEAPFAWENIFENPENLKDSEFDLFCLTKENIEQKKIMPKLYQACGEQDFLFEMNEFANRRFRDLGVDIKYSKKSGAHNWEYWDKEIVDAINWVFTS